VGAVHPISVQFAGLLNVRSGSGSEVHSLFVMSGSVRIAALGVASQVCHLRTLPVDWRRQPMPAVRLPLRLMEPGITVRAAGLGLPGTYPMTASYGSLDREPLHSAIVGVA